MKTSIANHQKISIVFAGRNDQYGGNFKSKLLAAWKRNYTEMITRGIEGEWIFVLDYLQNNTLLENIIYRAERRDIKSGLYTADFQKMLENTVMYYDSYGGQHFERGAGDFTLYNKNRIDFGHDENIKDSDIYIDIRFISNYLKKQESNSNISPGFKFIGTVFKEDHQLTASSL